jgi:hypothetical protein
MMVATLLRQATTFLNIGKIAASAVQLTPTLTTKFGKESGPYILFPDTKLYFGELPTMLFLSEVLSVTEGFNVLSYVPDVCKRKKPSPTFLWNVTKLLMFGLDLTWESISPPTIQIF